MSGHAAGHGDHGHADNPPPIYAKYIAWISFGIVVLIIVFWAKGVWKNSQALDAAAAQAAAEQRKIDATKPQPSGEGIATMDRPLVADINPRISKIEPIVPPGTVVKYTLITNPKIFFYDTAGYEMDRSARVRKWRSMPTGVYSLAPLDNEPITIKWSKP